MGDINELPPLSWTSAPLEFFEDTPDLEFEHITQREIDEAEALGQLEKRAHIRRIGGEQAHPGHLAD